MCATFGHCSHCSLQFSPLLRGGHVAQASACGGWEGHSRRCCNQNPQAEACATVVLSARTSAYTASIRNAGGHHAPA
jgi:hypothetical protein